MITRYDIYIITKMTKDIGMNLTQEEAETLNRLGGSDGDPKPNNHEKMIIIDIVDRGIEHFKMFSNDHMILMLNSAVEGIR